jgi:hypothetical protein
MPRSCAVPHHPEVSSPNFHSGTHGDGRRPEPTWFCESLRRASTSGQASPVALNTWWDGDPAQRYWMEVATTGSMGKILIAPKFPGATWSYDLVGLVRPGDRVLHWMSGTSGRGLVGWSAVTGEPEVVPEYTWQPRGTRGRALPGPRTTEGWMATLGGLNSFTVPLSSDELQEHLEAILALAAELESAHGKPTYFPYYLYGNQHLRAQQGYLVKFPVELFDLLPKIGPARVEATGGKASAVALDEISEDGLAPKWPVPKGTLTRVQDPELRSAIENHAVDRAIEHYESLGATDFVKLGKPYDVRLTLNGDERHVEVKGSSLLIETVELTINEVTHAETYQPTDLIVVDRIVCERGPDQKYKTSGGRLRIWWNWTPSKAHLSPRKFAYELPPA